MKARRIQKEKFKKNILILKGDKLFSFILRLFPLFSYHYSLKLIYSLYFEKKKLLFTGFHVLWRWKKIWGCGAIKYVDEQEICPKQRFKLTLKSTEINKEISILPILFFKQKYIELLKRHTKHLNRKMKKDI